MIRSLNISVAAVTILLLSLTVADAKSHGFQQHRQQHGHSIKPLDTPQFYLFAPSQTGFCRGAPVATMDFTLGECFSVPGFYAPGIIVTIPGDGSGQYTATFYSDVGCTQQSAVTYGLGTECQTTFDISILIPSQAGCTVDVFNSTDSQCQYDVVSVYDTVHSVCLQIINPNDFSGSFMWIVDPTSPNRNYTYNHYKDLQCENQIMSVSGVLGQCDNNMIVQCTFAGSSHHAPSTSLEKLKDRTATHKIGSHGPVASHHGQKHHPAKKQHGRP